jgi:hypothetical protein
LDTLALRDGPFGLISKCFRGCTSAQVLNAIATQFLAGQFNRPVLAIAAALAPTQPAEFLHSARRIWAETTALAGTLGERYFRGRGLTIALPGTLRFHRHLWCSNAETYAPAVVAAVFDVCGEQQAVHRTWLSPLTAGQANFKKPKMALAPVGGRSVWLGEPAISLILVEGIETGLSLMQLLGSGVPAWACLSTSGLQSVVLPERVRDVLIGADNDENGAGVAAANALRVRLLKEGRNVRVIMPRTVGWDFNNELRQRGDD